MALFLLFQTKNFVGGLNVRCLEKKVSSKHKIFLGKAKYFIFYFKEKNAKI
jgi:hypothetical protein